MEIRPVESALIHAARLRQRDGGHDAATSAFRDYANESKSQSGAKILRHLPRVRPVL